MTFSHKRHAPLRLPCTACHAAVKQAERAGYPSVRRCMECHRAVLSERPAIQRLAALPADAAPFPSGRHKALPDFVFFSHARHAAADVNCTSCHGAVLDEEAPPREAPRTMKACVDCHKSRSATVACNACHELNQ